MSDVSQGDGWWLAADLKWYPPELHADYVPPLPPPPKLPDPPKLPPPPKLPDPPRGEVAKPSGQAASTHSAIPAAPAIPAIPWDKVRRVWSGLSDARPSTPQGQGGQYAGAGGSRSTFDLREIMPGGLIVLVGSLLYVIFGFFPWWTINIVSGLGSYGIPSSSVSFNAWRSGSAVFSAIVFLVAAGAFLLKALKVIPAPKVPLEMIALGAVVLGDLLFLIAFFDVPSFASRGWGMWVDVVVLVGINVGAVLQFIRARVHPGV